MHLEREWHLRPTPSAALAAVQATAAGGRLPLLVQSLLAQRGVTTDEGVEKFLRPKLRHLSPPELLPNMAAAAARLARAVVEKEHVVLYGDYDVDGVTSLAILSRVFGALGLKVRTFLPLRKDEGYGLSREALTRCLFEGKPDLLMAVDCGTVSVAEVAWLREQGIDVIVLDHHEPSPAGVPDAIVVNPKLGGAFHYLCSAGLAFKCAHAVLKLQPLPSPERQAILEEVLDLVALGTVADVVPLIEENRLLVAKGLERLASTRNPGLRALKSVSGVNGKPRTQHLGFRLGPRLNAAGRLDTAQAALELLLSDNATHSAALAHQLDAQNRERRLVQARVEAEAMIAALEGGASESPWALVIGSDAWHAGVVGIVAGKLARQFHRPTFVVAFDEAGVGKGSGRSIEGVSLVAALDGCRGTLLKGGGHVMAAGITVERAQFDAFRAQFAAAVAMQLGQNDPRPRLWADAEVYLSDLDFEMLDFHDQLEPFGDANHQPLLLVRNVGPAAEPRMLKEKHRRLELHQAGTTVTAMWFESASIPLPPAPWDALLTLQRGEYRGEERVEIYVQDLRAAR
jgi:single-stranded-DNA-specific exonuclease